MVSNYKGKKSTWEGLRKELEDELGRYTYSGSYSGGSVEQSNQQAILRDFPEIVYKKWEHFGASLEIKEYYFLSRQLDEFVEVMNSLSEYPLYDDDEYYKVQSEMEHESLADDIDDFARELLEQFPLDEEKIEEIIFEHSKLYDKGISHTPLTHLFYEMLDYTNMNYEEETGGRFFVNIEELVKKASGKDWFAEPKGIPDCEGQLLLAL